MTVNDEVMDGSEAGNLSRTSMTENKPMAGLREHLAKWMIANGFATGHGDTLHDLLKEATWQVKEIRDENSKLREGRDILDREIGIMQQEIDRLTAELAAVKPKFMGLSPPPCDKCGYNGPGYYQPESHSCVGKKS